MAPIVLFSEGGVVIGPGGDQEHAGTGSGLAIPIGLEATFEYNGITLNDRAPIDKYRVKSIEGLDDPDVRDVREDRPQDDGEIIYRSFYGGRTLAIQGTIEAYSKDKLRDMQANLRTAFASLTEKPFIIRTGTPTLDHYVKCKKSSKIQMSEQQSDMRYFRDFLITLRASDPRFVRSQETLVTYNIGANINGPDVTNEGNFAARPIIEWYGPNTQPALKNVTTNRSIRFKSTAVVGGWWRMDFTQGSPTVIDNNGNNRFNQLAGTSDQMLILPGLNVMGSISGFNNVLSPASKIVIRFRDSWI